MNDLVNSPEHYKVAPGVEVIHVIEATAKNKEAFQAYCEGNVKKYVLRANKKGKYLEDLKKARVYLNYLIESIEGDKPF